jgi:hypothetical protein
MVLLMTQLNRAFVIAALGMLAALAICGCVQPLPPAPPGPPAVDAAADVFTGQIFDCHAVPLSERGNAVAPVGDCLASGYTPECLVDLVVTFAPATVACLARDLGSSANASVLAGDPSQKPKADNARAWIVAHNLGYK